MDKQFSVRDLIILITMAAAIYMAIVVNSNITS